MKVTIIMFIWFNSVFAICQDTIRLSYNGNPRSDFRVINPKDTTLIKVGHSLDMGVWYGQYYRLLNDIPDGEYLIFMNDTIEERCFIKNSKKDSVWVRYNKGIQHKLTPYKDGQINGYVKLFYESGNLWHIMKYKDNKFYIRTGFYPTGKIRFREYFVNNSLCRVEWYNEKGELTKSENKSSFYYYTLINIKENIEKGIYDGITVFRYKEGRFELNYRKGTLLHWSFHDDKNNLIIEEITPYNNGYTQ